MWVKGLMLVILCLEYKGSEFLHADHVDGLHIIFPGGDLVEDIVGQDLIVFDHAAHLQLLHAIGHFQDLGLIVPDKAVDLKGEDLLGKAVEVESCLVDLHVKDYDRFGNGLGLGSLGLGLLFGFRLFDWGCIIISEEIDVVLILCWGGLGGSGCVLGGPSLHEGGREDADEVIPVVDVGVSVHIDVF